jgi:hypothetical protein
VGSDGNALGVAEGRGRISRMHDALRIMADFSRAELRVAAAVAESLAGHQDAKAAAADRARRILELTVSMRGDIMTA